MKLISGNFSVLKVCTYNIHMDFQQLLYTYIFMMFYGRCFSHRMIEQVNIQVHATIIYMAFIYFSKKYSKFTLLASEIKYVLLFFLFIFL